MIKLGELGLMTYNVKLRPDQKIIEQLVADVFNPRLAALRQ